MIETIIFGLICLVVGFGVGFLVFRKHQVMLNEVEGELKEAVGEVEEAIKK